MNKSWKTSNKCWKLKKKDLIEITNTKKDIFKTDITKTNWLKQEKKYIMNKNNFGRKNEILKLDKIKMTYINKTFYWLV